MTNLKSVKLSSLQVSQLNMDQSAVIAIEAKGLSGNFFLKFSSDSILAIEKFQQISDGVNCIAAKDEDEVKL